MGASLPIMFPTEYTGWNDQTWKLDDIVAVRQ
jgi:hypothetical protein